MRELNAMQLTLLHRLNGQLLLALWDQLDYLIGWNPKHWIVNVLTIQISDGETNEACLKTSATLYDGELFDRPDKCNPRHGVGHLDRVVPLTGSFTGHCIRTNYPVWVDSITGLSEHDPLYRNYRYWQYVDVIPPQNPINAEYVFPIRTTTGFTQRVLGALNLECFSSENEFAREQGRHRNLIQSLVADLLELHSPFLQVLALRETGQSVRGITIDKPPAHLTEPRRVRDHTVTPGLTSDHREPNDESMSHGVTVLSQAGSHAPMTTRRVAESHLARHVAVPNLARPAASSTAVIDNLLALHGLLLLERSRQVFTEFNAATTSPFVTATKKARSPRRRRA